MSVMGITVPEIVISAQKKQKRKRRTMKARLIDADKLLEGIAELKQSPWFNNKYGYADRK